MHGSQKVNRFDPHTQVMDEEDVVERLMTHARENDADAVVVDVPVEVIRREGGVYQKEPDDHGRKVASTLLAGAVEDETDETLALDSPSRVGDADDFSSEVRQRLRADDVYGFRDGNLDGVELPKSEIEIHRALDEDVG